jgi:hypothetical protein
MGKKKQNQKKKKNKTKKLKTSTIWSHIGENILHYLCCQPYYI